MSPFMRISHTASIWDIRKPLDHANIFVFLSSHMHDIWAAYNEREEGEGKER